MTLDFFIKSYNFDDFDILNIELSNYTLKVEVNLQTHLDLIANGYRPELEMVIDKTFIFKNVNVEKLSFEKPYSINIIEYDNEKLSINVCNKELVINCSNVEII